MQKLIFVSMRRKVILLFSILVFSFSLKGQKKNIFQFFFSHHDSLISRYDTSRVDPLLDKVTLRLFLTHKMNEQKFSDLQGTNTYQNNASYRLGVGYGYRWFIFNFALYAPLSRVDQADKGKTLAYNVQMNIYGRKFLIDFRSQYYKGYFLRNTSSVFPGWQGNQKYFHRSDISLSAIGGSFRYNFDHGRFSFKGSYDQTQIMKKSGGAFEAGFRLSYQHLNGDSAITYYMDEFSSLNALESFNFGVGAGYTHTFVFAKKWFVTGTVTPYVNVQMVNLYREKGNVINYVSPYFTGVLRCAFGYTSPKYYIGVTWVGDRVVNYYNEASYSFTYTNFKLIYAYRFTSKWWKSKGL